MGERETILWVEVGLLLFGVFMVVFWSVVLVLSELRDSKWRRSRKR